MEVNANLMHRIEQDYMELGPRIATWWNLGFHWGDTKDAPWNIDVPTQSDKFPHRG